MYEVRTYGYFVLLFRNVEFHGYKLNKNTHIIPLLHAVHMDPNAWEDPEAFKPERFLAEDGSFTKPPHFMPFGKGRRMCLGDNLAERQFFLFLASILHTMDISAEDPENMPSFKFQTGVTVSPVDFKIRATPRSKVLSNLEDLLTFHEVNVEEEEESVIGQVIELSLIHI